MICNETLLILPEKIKSIESIEKSEHLTNEDYDENLTISTKESIEIDVQPNATAKIIKEADDENEPRKNMAELWLLFRGYVYVILFALCTAISSILMKKSFTLSGSDSAFIRYTIQLITMYAVAKWKGLSPMGLKKDRKLLVYRGLTGVLGLLSGFFAIKFINPSDFKAINHSSIVITAILARIFLKEKLTLAHIVAALLAITGVLLISKPSFLFSNYESIESHGNHLHVTIGVCFGLLAAFGGGSAKVILKKLCSNKVHFSVATIYASYFGMPLSMAISIFLITSGLSHKNFSQELEFFPLHLCLTILAGFTGVIGQVFLNLGLKYEDTAKLAIIKTIDVFFAFLLQYIFLNITEDLLTIFGALTIISGAFLVLVLKLIEKKLKLSQKRKKSWCVKIIFFKF